MRKVYRLLFVSAMLIGNFVQLVNPFGFGQRLFFGMRPPYHWVQQDVSRLSAGSIEELYIGTNGKSCAKVYHYALAMGAMYVVYGFGFRHYDVLTREEAEKYAERECR